MIFAGLLPDFVALAEMDPRNAEPDGLDPRELAFVSGAVEKRRREFAAGRLLARRLGVPAPLLVGPDGAPMWPAGLVGAITHCDTLAAVAIARTGSGLGIDLEPAIPLPGDVRSLVLTDSERDVSAMDATVIFSAKEAIYKAISARVGRFVEFHEVRVRLKPDRFIADGPGGVLQGRYRIEGGFVATGVWVG